MKTDYPGYPCGCKCHAQIIVHATPCCECGKPVTPPRPPCPPPKPHCCPPPPKPQPGVGNVPQETPPPNPKISPAPPWTVGKPKADDPSEIPWFRGKIGDIRRNGPTFGPRKDEYLPFLLMRTASGDRGNREIKGVFWESPDIFIAPNQDADTAPLMPPTTGGLATANRPNTLYAHVWNVGKAPAYRARVEFYWFNPSLGITQGDANLIGAAWVDLGNRFDLQSDWTEVRTSYGRWMSHGSHAIVRCPQTWYPKFENNGHECLVVRVFDPILDTVKPSQFSAAKDRHVAQRNIAVVQAASPASIDLMLDLGYPDAPTEAEVEVELDTPSSMEWLQLYAGTRNPGYVLPAGPVIAGLLPPTAMNTRAIAVEELPAECRPPLLKPKERFHRGCDPLRIEFHASAQELKQHEAQVMRIRQKVGPDVVGGYSVILIKA